MAEHKAEQPRGVAVAFFIPIKSFMGKDKDGNLLASYKQGKRYTVREGNQMLMDLCAEWQKEKLIIIGA